MKQNYIALVVVLLVLGLGGFFIWQNDGIQMKPTGDTSIENPDDNAGNSYSADDVSKPETIVCTIGKNEYSFTMRDFIDEMHRIMAPDFEQKMSQLSAPDQKLHRKNLEKQVMDFLIESGYVELYFKDSGLVITEAEIEAEKEKTRKSLIEQSGKPDLDVDAYFTELGVTDEKFAEDMKNQIMFRKIFAPLMDNVTLSDKDTEAFYNENVKDFVVPKQANIDVMISYKQEEVDQILSKYRAGTDFGALVEEYSEDPQLKQSKGVIGWVSESDLPPDMIRHIFNDVEFEKTDVIAFPMETMFYIVRRNEVKASYTPSFQEIKDKVKTAALDAKREQAYKAFIEEQKKVYGEAVIAKNIIFPSDTVSSTIPPNTLKGMEGSVENYMNEQKNTP